MLLYLEVARSRSYLEVARSRSYLEVARSRSYLEVARSRSYLEVALSSHNTLYGWHCTVEDVSFLMHSVTDNCVIRNDLTVYAYKG